MGEYISVCLDFNVDHEHNRGLRSIIEYIGLREYPEKACASDKDHLYKLGKKYINSKLNKWHLTALNRLVESTYLLCVCDHDDVRWKIVWKIHRRKAQKIFKKIKEIIARYDNTEINNQFKQIQQLYFLACKSVDRAELIGSPYYTRISDEVTLAANEYTEQEIKDLGKVASAIARFSS